MKIEMTKKKILIYGGLIVASLGVIGGVTCYHFLNRESSSESPSEDPLTKRERETKEKIFKNTGWDESKIKTLLLQTSYLGDAYPNLFKSNVSFEEKLVICTSIFKTKQIDVFTSIPASNKEFTQKLINLFSEKNYYLISSLIPRKSNGDPDWVKFEEGFYQVRSISKDNQDNWNYLENKVKPALKAVWNNPANGDFPTEIGEAIKFLNRLLNDYINETFYVSNDILRNDIISTLNKTRGNKYKFNWANFVIPQSLTGATEEIGAHLLLPDWTSS